MEKNQIALHTMSKYAALPINHVDAGVAVLKKNNDFSVKEAALAVFSHY